jgi:hypothetical protein
MYMLHFLPYDTLARQPWNCALASVVNLIVTEGQFDITAAFARVPLSLVGDEESLQ